MTDKQTPCFECRRKRRKCVRVAPGQSCLRCQKMDKMCPRKEDNAVEPDNELDYLKEQVCELNQAIQRMEHELKTLGTRSPLYIKNNAMTLPRSAIDNLLYNWKIEINNGCFTIETGIKSIGDLLSQQPSLRYMSPLSSYATQLPDGSSALVRFKLQGHGSLFSLAGKIIPKLSTKKRSDEHKLLLGHVMFSSRSLIDKLVDIYFNCHNLYCGWLHESSFRKRYSQLKEPLDDLICASLCCYVCATPCDHLDFNAYQRRDMCDYFYLKAKEKLVDQFDEPDKRLENVIAINMLFSYMHMTLKLIEYDTYVTISTQICYDLQSEYEAAKIQTGIDYALFARHFTQISCVRLTLDCIANKPRSHLPNSLPKMNAFPYEPKETKEYLQVLEWLNEVYSNPVMDRLEEQVHILSLGNTCALSFDTIFKLEQFLTDFRKMIPKDLQLCDDFFNEAKYTIYVMILQPIPTNDENDILLQHIQQIALERSSQMTRLMLYGMRRLYQLKSSSHCQVVMMSSMFMFYLIDLLVLQCSSTVEAVVIEGQQLLQECLVIINTIRGVQCEDTFPQLLDVKRDIRDFIHSRKVDIDYYDRFPDPWCALLHDISRCFL
ncbi:hypothetical protein G6F70_004828 [Rhizopus microsporus]|nr:hypothetical protein G6F71_004439 [Rhizopus microsporus]KAG1199554.1 hypothetical protein G6F70_004828 [Rhizopus microsporus]KAG1211334.1 hypothetical protein G6F69_004690 [Rhizopus microsporus]KAG1233267.1 hypothetical protein G6F67_004392 [Rhizopus microsporus]KAG1260066.1 hypothetical protein G6F68_007695 [Rhizopus microsporus]